MSIATYSELKTSVLDFMVRTGQTGKVGDWIALAEARLNRQLGAVETNVTVTGTPDSREIDVSAHSVERPIALFLAEAGQDEVFVSPKAEGTFPRLTTTGRPTKWAMNGSSIVFDRPLDAAYPFRFRIRQRFALSSLAPTNWLLTYHPDLYLAATIVWGHAYNKSPEVAPWKELLDETVPSVRSAIAETKRATLSVDPALTGRGGLMSLSEWTNG